jgi:cytidyltransferase-like protein
MKKVLVFGIFNGVHKGHVSFFRHAKKHGDFLTVAVGRASASKKFKNKTPEFSLKDRIKFVREVNYVNKALPGDIEQGSYGVVLREKPDIICLGWDQQELGKDLKRWLKGGILKIAIKSAKKYPK